MRIQEHLFQGFFGIKKKQDSAKYYSKRVEKLKGLDVDLDNCIEEFQKVLNNHNKKIESYELFLKNLDKESLEKFKNQVLKLETVFDDDELSVESEKRYITKMENILSELIKNEENNEMSQIQNETLMDLKELSKMIESIKPLWEEQIELVKNEIISKDKISKDTIQKLTEVFKKESNLLHIENTLLKKIDLKTSNLLRKTTLKLKNLEKTDNMNMRYREIKHIR